MLGHMEILCVLNAAFPQNICLRSPFLAGPPMTRELQTDELVKVGDQHGE